jgi:hypothetical protein
MPSVFQKKRQCNVPAVIFCQNVLPVQQIQYWRLYSLPCAVHMSSREFEQINQGATTLVERLSMALPKRTVKLAGTGLYSGGARGLRGVRWSDSGRRSVAAKLRF